MDEAIHNKNKTTLQQSFDQNEIIFPGKTETLYRNNAQTVTHTIPASCAMP